MAGMKLGKRLKKSFSRRQSSKSSTAALSLSDEVQPSSSYQSAETGTTSLDSNARDHGPIDTDSCRKYKKRGKKKSSYDKPAHATTARPSGSRGERRGRRNRGRSDSSISTLPMIDEIQSNASASTFSITLGSLGRLTPDSMSTRSVHSMPHLLPPVMAKHSSPASAHKVQSVSSYSTKDTEPLIGFSEESVPRDMQDKHVAETPKISNCKRQDSSGSSSFFSSSLLSTDQPSTRSPSPSILSRIIGDIRSDRNSRTGSPSTACMLEEAECLLKGESQCDEEATLTTEVMLEEAECLLSNEIQCQENGSTVSSVTNNRSYTTSSFASSRSSPKPTRYGVNSGKESPTGVDGIFDCDQSTELDQKDSVSTSDLGSLQSSKQSSKFSMKSQLSNKLLSSSQASVLSRISNKLRRDSPSTVTENGDNASIQTESAASCATPSLNVERKGPSDMLITKSTAKSDPPAYTSLSDVVKAQTTMRIDVGTETATAVARATGVTTATRTTHTNHSASCDNTDAEVEESMTDLDASIVTEIASLASIATSIATSIASSTKSEKKVQSKEFLALKKEAEKNEFKNALLIKKTAATAHDAETTEVLAALSLKDATRVTSIEPQENVELQAILDAMGGSRESEGDMRADPPGLDGTGTRSNSPTLPNPAKSRYLQPEESSTAADKQISDLVIDVKKSLSLEQDVSMEYSISDSYSYMSNELETIDSITICEETTRLLEAQKAYTQDIMVNPNHPSRRQKSCMKTGSHFQQRSSTTTKSDTNRKLTWYDDEVNWEKPFLLRTDESFDGSTVTTIDYRMNMGSIVQHSLVDQFGDFIKGLEKYANCGGEEDVTSYDAVGQTEM